MAQSGYTPILIYASGATGNTPSSSNLTSSSSGAELALNYYDGKLFYKDSGGTVQVLAGKGGTGVVAGSNTQIQFNNNGVFGASSGLTWDGSFLTATSIKDSALTSGRVTFAGASGLLTDSSGLTWDGTTFAASNISTGGSVTLSGGTANGVVYLNGSKVATSGSALVFDGTNLGIGVASPAQLIDGTAANPRLKLTATSTGYAASQFVNSSGSSYFGRDNSAGGFFGIANGTVVYSGTNDPIGFYLGGSEQMRLTSTGLGIGTSSPSYKLDVSGQIRASVASSNAQLRLERTTTSAGHSWLGASSSSLLEVLNSSFSTLLTLDSSGNLGLGVTPGAWVSGASVFQAGAYAAYGQGRGGTADLVLSWNATVTSGASSGTGYVYRNTGDVASSYEQNGAHRWYTAPSGTAGNAITFTQAMTLDASGNLLLGTTTVGTTGNVGLTIFADSQSEIRLQTTASGTGTTNGFQIALGGTDAYLWNLEYGATIFATNNTERARITSGGDLLIGDTTNTLNTRLHILGTNNVFDATNTTSAAFTAVIWNQGTTGDNKFYEFATEGSYAARGSIDYNRAGGLTRYNTTSDYRAKDIIGPVQNPGATIDALKVYEGVMKGATQSRPMLVAHEAQAHAPYAVSGFKDEVNEDGTPRFQQIDVSSLVPLLLAELQSLRARVSQLESK